MNQKMKTLIPLLALLPMCLNATTVVDLGGEYLTGTGFRVSNSNAYTQTDAFSGNFDPNTAGTDTAVAITLGSVWAPLSSSTNLATPAGKSGANLKMGAIMTNNDSAIAPGQDGVAFQYHRITQDASDATFQFSGSSSSHSNVTGDMSLASIFYYEKADFLNGGAAATSIAFEAGDVIGATFGMGGGGGGRGRMLLQNEGSWYISVDSAGLGVQSLEIESTDLFYSFDPSGDNFISDLSGPTVAASTFTDIDAVGIHMQALNYDGADASRASQYFNGITANLTAIPEPSTFAMLAGVLALGVVFTRRRVR